MSGDMLEKNQRGLVLLDAAAGQLGLEAVDRAAAVRVQEAAQELPRMRLDDLLLPRLEDDRPLMLATAAMLGESLEPTLPAALDAHAPELAMRANPHMPPPAGLDDRASALIDEVGVRGVADNHELAFWREPPVAEVPPEEIGIRRIVGRRP
jgi:hypothetical protein